MKKYKYLSISLLIISTLLANAQTTLQQAPAKLPADFPKLSPLLKSSDGKTISTKADWEKQRKHLREEWLKVLGGFPKKKAPLKAEFLAKEDLGDFTRQYVKHQNEEGIFTDGYLLTPKNIKGSMPAIVVFHPTTTLQAKGVAGLAPEYAEEKRQAVQLVQRGYIVWCPRNFIFDEGTGTTNSTQMYVLNTKRVQKQHPNSSGMSRMVWDAIRAADFVESLPNVDRTRIGCIGHSLGGKQALYAPAFDERYKASVSSEGGIGLNFSNWEAVWYFGPQIKSPDFHLENHEVLSLVAPRAFLLLAGQFDDDKSWAFIQAAMPIYNLLGAPGNIGWFNHRMGHRYSPEARAVAEAFLDAHLKKAAQRMPER